MTNIPSLQEEYSEAIRLRMKAEDHFRRNRNSDTSDALKSAIHRENKAFELLSDASSAH